MPPEPKNNVVQGMRPLLRYLLTCTDVQVPEAILSDAAAIPNEDWRDALTHALPAVGMREAWFESSLADASTHARPDLPLVTYVEAKGTEGWVVLDIGRLGHVHVWSSSSFLPQGWFRPEQLAEMLDMTSANWARVEAILPSSSLSAPSDTTFTPMQRLTHLLRAERDTLAVVVTYAVAVGVLSLATPLAIQILINWLAFGALYQPVVILAGGLLLCLVLAAGLASAQRYSVEVMQRRLFVRTVTDLGSRLSRVKVESLDGSYGPELVNRFFDVLTLQKAMKTLLIDGLTAALQAAVGLLLLAMYHPYLLIFDLLVIAMVGAALLPLALRGQETAIKESKLKYEVAAWVEEVARHPLVFKLGGGGLAEARLEQLSREYVSKRAAHFRVFFGQYLSMHVVTVLLQVGLLLTAGWLVLDGQLTLGQLVAAEFIVASALAGLAKFTDKLETVYDLLAGVDKLGTLMDLPHERLAGALIKDRSTGATLSLHEVRYHWEGTTNAAPWTANLEVPRGARMALVGKSGSGKSVLAEILVGLRKPTSGEIRRDGIPLSRLHPEQTFADTILVRSEGWVHGSILDNICIGRVVDEEHLWSVLRSLEVDRAIAALPDGLETEIGLRGAPLSTTEANALLIARALVRPPRLLIIDSLFDGASPKCRERWCHALAQLPRSTTLVVLTEDLSVANSFETLFEIRDGGLHARPRLSTI